MYETSTKNSQKEQTPDFIFPRLKKQGKNAPPKKKKSVKNKPDPSRSPL